MEFIQRKHFTEEQIAEYKEDYKVSKPYKHVIINDFLSEEIAEKLSKQFPSDDLFNKRKKGMHENKLEGDQFDIYPEIFSALKKELATPEFSKLIEEVTGIKDAFITDDGFGVCIQKGKRGSFEDVHVDFNIHPLKNVQRRLNLEIYLTPEWHAEWNGAVEMWNDCVSKCKKAVMPKFNRALLFEVNDCSYYGYTKPLETPENISRKMFSATFYTPVEEDVVFHDTVFHSRPDDKPTKKLLTSIQETLKTKIKTSLKKAGK